MNDMKTPVREEDMGELMRCVLVAFAIGMAVGASVYALIGMLAA